MTPLVTQSVARVLAWLATNPAPKTKIADDAGIDDKTIRLALKADNWNPTADTLEKLEKLIPADWQPESVPRKAKRRTA